MSERDAYDFVIYRQLKKPFAWKWLYDPARLIDGQRFTGSKRAEEAAEALTLRDQALRDRESRKQIGLYEEKP